MVAKGRGSGGRRKEVVGEESWFLRRAVGERGGVRGSRSGRAELVRGRKLAGQIKDPGCTRGRDSLPYHESRCEDRGWSQD